MKIRYLLTATLALINTAAFAGDYKTCHISSGNKTDCSMPYTGNTVTLDQGQYKTCHISSGNKTDCSMPYTGNTVTLDQN